MWLKCSSGVLPPHFPTLHLPQPFSSAPPGFLRVSKPCVTLHVFTSVISITPIYPPRLATPYCLFTPYASSNLTISVMRSSGQAPKGPPMAPDPPHPSCPPSHSQPSLFQTFHHSVTSLLFLINPSHTFMSPEPSPSKQRHIEPSPILELSPSSLVMPPFPLQVQRHSSTACLPTHGSAHAASYDLHSAEAKWVPAQGRALINTQVSITIPLGTYGHVAPCSGLTSKFSINISAGIVNSDYWGVIYILLLNHSDHNFKVNIGDRIAQLILEQIITLTIIEVQDLNTSSSPSHTSLATVGHLEQSHDLKIKSLTPQQTSLSSLTLPVQPLATQTSTNCNPCPET